MQLVFYEILYLLLFLHFDIALDQHLPATALPKQDSIVVPSKEIPKGACVLSVLLRVSMAATHRPNFRQ